MEYVANAINQAQDKDGVNFVILKVEGLAKFIQLAGLKCISNFEILKVKDGKEKVSKVSLKSLDNSSDIRSNNVKPYISGNFSVITKCYGITQDPNTK
ncbi:11285_t:CDS:2 [Rhizophagus irregularis]|nr:11285_t:CDS:2 [Rhizophagus irregularis]